MKNVIENNEYWNGLTKDYGSKKSGDDKSKRFQSDFTLEELYVGMKVHYVECDTISEITDLTSSSVETFNLTNQNNKYKKGGVDADGEEQSGKLKGINAKNWYGLDTFNRTFKRI